MPPDLQVIDYGFAVALLWWIVKDLLGIIKGRANGGGTCVKKEDLEQIKSWLKDLHEWHNVKTEDGHFAWHKNAVALRLRALEKAVEAMEKAAEAKVKTLEKILDKLEAR